MKRSEYITDNQVVTRANSAVTRAIEKKRITDTPVVVYDRSTQRICNLNSDGTRTPISERRTRGRYSERINGSK